MAFDWIHPPLRPLVPSRVHGPNPNRTGPLWILRFLHTPLAPPPLPPPTSISLSLRSHLARRVSVLIFQATSEPHSLLWGSLSQRASSSCVLQTYLLSPSLARRKRPRLLSFLRNRAGQSCRAPVANPSPSLLNQGLSPRELLHLFWKVRSHLISYDLPISPIPGSRRRTLGCAGHSPVRRLNVMSLGMAGLNICNRPAGEAYDRPSSRPGPSV